MAVACAAAALLGRRALGLDVVFLIEGEEEVDSAGFSDAVEAHKVMVLIYQWIDVANLITQDLIGNIDAILVRYVHPCDNRRHLVELNIQQ
jgi:hypothetical protein